MQRRQQRQITNDTEKIQHLHCTYSDMRFVRVSPKVYYKQHCLTHIGSTILI